MLIRFGRNTSWRSLQMGGIIRFSNVRRSGSELGRWYTNLKYHNDLKDGDSIVDLRSDTVTRPSREMLECALTERVGDDVFGEDPTVLELEEYATNMFPGMAGALYVPTGTMANLIAMASHCTKDDASEVLVGAHSHICLWEGGNASTVAHLHSRQLMEDAQTAQINLHQLNMAVRTDNDDHFPKTRLLCLENTHNLLGGIPLSSTYLQEAFQACKSHNIHLHIDGARFFHAAIDQQYSYNTLFTSTDTNAVKSSMSICLSKGLGAPCGSLLIANDEEFLRIAKRFRKRYGGGMRQTGVIASMGLYALQNNIDRLQQDHQRATKLAAALTKAGYIVNYHNTNLVFFSLPKSSSYFASPERFVHDLHQQYGIKIGWGYQTLYNPDQQYFRAAAHLDISDEDIERAIHSLTSLISSSN